MDAKYCGVVGTAASGIVSGPSRGELVTQLIPAIGRKKILTTKLVNYSHVFTLPDATCTKCVLSPVYRQSGYRHIIKISYNDNSKV